MGADSTMNLHRKRLCNALLAVALVGGCDQSDEAPRNIVPPAPSPAAPVRVNSAHGYNELCAGREIQPAPATKYEKKPGMASPVLVLMNVDGSPEESSAYKLDRWEPGGVGEVLGPWKAESLETSELVACIHVMKQDKLGECSFKERTLEQYAFEGTLSVFEASTGRLLEKEAIRGDQRGECPYAWSFKDTREVYLDGLSSAALKALAKYQPDDAPPPKIPTSELVEACAGSPTLGAATYRSQSGSENSFVVFTREGTQPYRRANTSLNYREPPPWRARNEQAEPGTDTAFSLAMCMTATRKKKLRDCKYGGSGTPKVSLYETSWDVRLVEARSGRELGSTKVDGKRTCPKTWSFAFGNEYLPPPETLTDFFAPFVDPA